jgi:hypothetical protein
MSTAPPLTAAWASIGVFLASLDRAPARSSSTVLRFVGGSATRVPIIPEAGKRVNVLA